jgi:hypothetical protein
MSGAELRELGENIKADGLQSPVIIYDGQLLDGRNRLDAMALVGIKFEVERSRSGNVSLRSEDIDLPDPIDLMFEAHTSYAGDLDDCVISANLRRRHLTAEQKRELIAKLLKAKPEASDRQIAKHINADHKTVGKIRSEAEGRGEIPHEKTRTDTKGRKQPAKKPKAAKQKLEPKPQPQPQPANKPKRDKKARTESQGEISAEDRKAQMAALDPDPEPVQPDSDAADDWRRAIYNHVREVIAVASPAWGRGYGNWQTFHVPSDLVTLVKALTEFAAVLEKQATARSKDRAA